MIIDGRCRQIRRRSLAERLATGCEVFYCLTVIAVSSLAFGLAGGVRL